MFDRLFGKGNRQAVANTPIPVMLAATASVAPDSEVSYHADLIERFTGHHVALRKVFATLRGHTAADRFKEAEKSLQTFRHAFTGHLLEENVKLYTYLTKCLAADEGSLEVMLDMRAEMMRIGKSVMGFVGCYVAIGINADNKRRFLVELDAVGEVLVERMEREEDSLYTMYMPPEAFI